MRPAALIAAAAAAAVAGLVVVLPAAATVTVGYLLPGIDYGTTTTENGDDSSGGSNSQPELPPGQIRAQGLVVDQLEPARRELGTEDVCPPDGCAYALVVLDAEALDAAAAAAGTQASGCNSLDFATIAPDPASRPLGGARVYTGQGRLAAQTTPPADVTDHPPRPVAAGLGHLCLVTRPGDQGLTDDDGDGPLAATQPKPVVVFHDPTARPGS